MARKIKRYKVGIDSETYAISMVESPAIESDFVAGGHQRIPRQGGALQQAVGEEGEAFQEYCRRLQGKVPERLA